MPDGAFALYTQKIFNLDMMIKTSIVIKVGIKLIERNTAV